MLTSKVESWRFLMCGLYCFCVKISLRNVCMSSPVSRNQDPQSCVRRQRSWKAVLAAYLFITVLSSKACFFQHAIGLIELFKKLLFLLRRKKAGLSCIYILWKQKQTGSFKSLLPWPESIREPVLANCVSPVSWTPLQWNPCISAPPGSLSSRWS